jgi:response regulator RpfG family c-di-GMP phosphodiesterase
MQFIREGVVMERKKVLLVDDDKDFVTTIKYTLQINGFEVIEAYDGITALEKAKEKPDIILLDVRMPGMNGFEVLRKLHSDPDTEEIPIIMLTLTGDIDSIFKAEGLRVKDYVMKTASLEKILEKVKKYLDKNGERLTVKVDQVENCWDYWKCTEKEKNRCVVCQKEWQKLCWLATSRPQGDRGFQHCSDCPWYHKKMDMLKK